MPNQAKHELQLTIRLVDGGGYNFEIVCPDTINRMAGYEPTLDGMAEAAARMLRSYLPVAEVVYRWDVDAGHFRPIN